jgi:hypothetical protein
VLVLDSRPLELIGPADREAFEATDRACALLDWRYAVWGRLDGVVVANQKWLAGYRHPRCFDEQVAAPAAGGVRAAAAVDGRRGARRWRRWARCRCSITCCGSGC